MAKEVKSHTICGKRYKIVWVPPSKLCGGTADGTCDHPTTKGKKIQIATKLSDKDTLETVIHEIYHASDPNLSEEAVNEMARDMASLLWRLGYRRQKE